MAQRPPLTVLVLAVVLSSAAGLCLAGDPPAPTTSPPAGDGPQPVAPPKPKRPAGNTQGWFRGVVTAVGDDWIELAPGWEGKWAIRVRPGTNKKPARIDAAGTIVGGDANGEPVRGPTHLVSDVKVGDTVFARTVVDFGGEEWCEYLEIHRRPGGTIPGLQNDLPNYVDPRGIDRRTHVKFQAYQDWEEKGVPIPARFLNAEGRTPTGAWVNPPYPPIAPQPREVTR